MLSGKPALSLIVFEIAEVGAMVADEAVKPRLQQRHGVIQSLDTAAFPAYVLLLHVQGKVTHHLGETADSLGSQE